ncbi:hypothetical protein INR49_011272 [Caranx melampygus]|nr:hypothetical protein INR49_011272 [Caranx melampygus]
MEDLSSSLAVWKGLDEPLRPAPTLLRFIWRNHGKTDTVSLGILWLLASLSGQSASAQKDKSLK